MGELYPPTVTIPVYAVFTGVGLLLTALRFWARACYTKAKLGIDDWLIFGGMIIVCACTGIQFYNALEGTGGEAIDKDDADAAARISKKVDFTMVLIEKPAFGAIKLSLLFFYKRIFGVWSSFNKANVVLIWIIVGWVVAFVVADLSICGDKLQYYFMLDQSYARGHCGDKGMLLLMFAVTSVLTDAAVLSLPFVYIRRLQMPPQKKWATGLVFLLGFISTAAGVLRTIFLSIAYPVGRLGWGYTPPPDQEEPLVLQVFNPTFWVMVEMCLGAWAANLPPLGPLLGAMGFREAVGSVYRRISDASSAFSSSFSGSKQRSRARSEDLGHQNSQDSLMSAARKQREMQQRHV